MHPGFFDMFHDGTDDHFTGVVSDGVDVDFDRVLEEPVDQDRTLRRKPAFTAEGSERCELFHCGSQAVVVIDDLHCTATEHIARADQRWVADVADHRERSLGVGCRVPRRLRDADALTQGVPLLPIFCEVDRLR